MLMSKTFLSYRLVVGDVPLNGYWQCRAAFLHFIHRNEHIGIFGHAYIARACAGGGTAPYTTLALATGGSFEFVYIITE